jgi:hypothetical protein
MNTITKTIICGIAAFALYACSSDNSTSPEHTGTASTQAGFDKGVQQISLGPSEEAAYIETILEGKPISNMIAVDPPLCVNDTDGVEWCPPYRVKTESGTLLHAWGGIAETIYCERASDTISLDVFLHNNTITKRWINPLFTAFDEAKQEFRDSCASEGGRITEDTESTIACELTLEPLNTDKEYTPPPEGEISLEFSFHYYDPSWEVFASKTIWPCRIPAVIEE